MKWKMNECDRYVGRRTILTGIAAIAGVTTAGCNNSIDDNGEDKKTLDSASVPHGTSNEFEAIKADVESVYETLSSYPVVKDGQFVFDVKAFETDFDHEALVDKLEDSRNRIHQLNSRIATKTERESLLSVAKLARQLVRQRLLIHQVIAAGLTYERRFRNLEYQEATKAIRNARYYLDELTSNGEIIKDKLNNISKSDISVDGYNSGTFRTTQGVLVELSLWANPAYEGLHHAIKGFSLFKNGNQAIKNDEFRNAAENYKASRASFEDAYEVLNDASNQGRRIPQIESVVTGINCIIPVYIEASASLNRSVNDFKNGNQQRAEEIIREAIKSTEEKMSRCL